MPTKNDITGDSIKSRTATPIYRENYEKIFSKPVGIIENKPLVRNLLKKCIKWVCVVRVLFYANRKTDK